METTTSNINRSIHISTVLDAPVDLVWKTWTQPDLIAQWWGPDGFTNTIHAMNLEAGGEWRLTMKDPDGKNYPNKSEFVEIIPNSKIIFKHYNPNYLATIVFSAHDNTTHLDWTMLFETPEMFETVVKVFKADEGLKQNVGKLKNFLLKLKSEL